jgi:outer membrane protein
VFLPQTKGRILIRIYAVVLFIYSFCSFTKAENILTVNDAIAIALKNNFGILVAGNTVEIAKLNNSAGNAGMLPSLSATAQGNYSFNSDNSNSATSADAAVELNWTLFDGGKMFVTKSKLAGLETLNKIQYKDKVQKFTADVIAAYYDIVRQKQELISVNEVIAYNTERVKIEKASFTNGLSAKTYYLQAQIDLNVNKEIAVNQITVISIAKRTLNQLLGRDPFIDFSVQDSLITENGPDTIRMMEKLSELNTDILSLQKQVDVAALSLTEYRTLQYPKISVNADYHFLRIDNTVNSPTFSRNFGPSIGAVLTLPLYQAGSISRQIAISGLLLQSAQYSLEDSRRQIFIQARNALDDYNNQRQLILIEKENTMLAKENFDISMQRLRLGQSTSLELSQAQESYEQARTRLINIQYNLKIAETKLKQLLAEL